MDVTAISGMISGLKAAAELAKLAINARDAAIIRTKAIELEREILAAYSSALTAQADQFALLSRVRELEKEVAELKAWDAESEKYQLTELRPGAFAYVLKEGTSSPEPPHKICPNCYQERRKSILQQIRRDVGRLEILFCQSCGAEINLTGISYEAAPPPKPPRRRR